MDFGETRSKLADILERGRNLPSDPSYSHVAVLLIQLVNASRVSEAFDATKSFALYGGRKVDVKVRKKRFRCAGCLHAKGSHKYEYKKRTSCTVNHCECVAYSPDTSDIELRLMVIPPEITESDRKLLSPHIKTCTVGAVKVYALRSLGFNTHSLRYAAISDLSSKAPLQVIAKITHHKSLNFIVDYTQKKLADKTLTQFAEAK